MRNRKNSFGITFIELMLALMLSVFMINIIFKIYLAAKNNEAAQTALISLQDNEQIISEFLTQQIHNAGYAGCAKLTGDFPFYNHTAWNINASNKIQIYHSQDIKPGTDAITIWYANMHDAMLIKSMRDNSILYVSNSVSYSSGDMLMISDCKSVELFTIKKVLALKNETIKIISNKPLNKLFQKNAELSVFEVNSFFVGDTRRLNAYNQPIYALYLRNRQGVDTELAQGIDDMHVANDVRGLSFLFQLSSVTHFDLHKNWYVYVALH